MKTQREIVIDKLLSDGHISRNWCLERRITRLGAIICDLNSDKWEIAGEWQKTDRGRDYTYRLVNAPLKKVAYRVDGVIVAIGYELKTN